ncbi:DUF1194 domain-containing protein [Shumkonia mesophila]|uniref:DUF1194 domain-containing protein n=1 Tax=Shumkonia mesophila TaxID=2838854 RepID=UPI002934C56D|nr:DUF1194 domain-containing protein [Shumkonia mesophila]
MLLVGSVVTASLVAVAVPGDDVRADVAVDLELVLAVDVSGSVDSEEALLQREGYLGALTHPDVIRAIKGGYRGAIAVSYVEWAGIGHRTVVAGWAEVRDAESAQGLVDRIGRTPVTRGMYTSISHAIDFAVPMFAGNGFEGARRVIDISGDGANNEGRLVSLARDAAVAAHITVNGLPIINDRANPFGQRQIPDLDLYYRYCVIGGPGAFMVVAEGFGSFAEAVRRKLVSEIAGIAPAGGTLVVRAPAEPARPRVLRAAATAPFAPTLPAAGFLRAASRQPPPCDIGEQSLEQRRRNFNEN